MTLEQLTVSNVDINKLAQWLDIPADRIIAALNFQPNDQPPKLHPPSPTSKETAYMQGVYSNRDVITAKQLYNDAPGPYASHHALQKWEGLAEIKVMYYTENPRELKAILPTTPPDGPAYRLAIRHIARHFSKRK